MLSSSDSLVPCAGVLGKQKNFRRELFSSCSWLNLIQNLLNGQGQQTVGFTYDAEEGSK